MEQKLIRSHRELEVYQLGFAAAMRIFELSKHFPAEEWYSLAKDSRLLACSSAPLQAEWTIS